MSNYSGKDHVAAAFARELTDRVPVRVWYGVTVGALAAGVTAKQVRTEPQAYAQMTIKAQDVLHNDTVPVAAFDAVMFAEGAGDGLGLTLQEIIDQARKGVSLLEDKATFAKFKLPDLMQKVRLPYYVEICKILKSEIGDAALDVVITGPWTTAAELRGAEKLIYDTADDPGFVNELMRHCTDYTKMIGAAIVEAGADIVTFGDPSSGTSVISPAMFRKWSKPYLEETINYLRVKGATLCLHVCGKVDPIMEDMVAIGVDAISIDGPSSLKQMVDISQGRLVTIGNAPTGLFVEGTKEQLEAAARDCIDTAAAGGAYILSSGCQIPENASLENVLHFLEYARQYGRYDRLWAS
jgi:uroporphyrinogen decarboxylase